VLFLLRSIGKSDKNFGLKRNDACLEKAQRSKEALLRLETADATDLLLQGAER